MPEESQENDPSEMTFLEHLEEMRFVIIKILAFFSVALVFVLVFFHYFNSMMLYPLNSAKEILANWVGDEQVTDVKTERIGPVYLVPADGDGKTKTGPYYIEPKDDSIVLFKDKKPANPWYADIKLRSMSFTTPIVVYFYVGFLGALGLSLPAAFYFSARFVAPGLKKEELAMLRPGIIAAIFLFAVGVCFAFFFMLPMGIAFMSWMSQGMQMEMFPDAQSYYSMVIFLTMAVGVTFELPLVEFILIYLGVLDTAWLKNNRRMVFLIILIFATVITPPDAITQVSLTIPLYLMYEVALRLGEKMRNAKLRRDAERERLEEIDEIGRLDDLRGMVDVVDHLVELVVQLAADELSHVLGGIGAVQADLRGDHGRRLVGAHAAVLDDAGLGVQAGGDVDGDDAGGRFVERGDPDGEGRAELAVEPGPEDGVDHEVRAGQQVGELVTGRPHDDLDVATRCAARHMAREGGGHLARPDGRGDRHMGAALLQDISGDPAVTAVVAESGEDDDLLGIVFLGDSGDELAGMLHELGFRGAFALDDVLEPPDFLSAQNGFHQSAPVLPGRRGRPQRSTQRTGRCRAHRAPSARRGTTGR